MKEVTFQRLGENVGSFIAIVDNADKSFLVGKLSLIEPFKYGTEKIVEGIYATIGGTQYEFEFSDKWATLYVVDPQTTIEQINDISQG